MSPACKHENADGENNEQARPTRSVREQDDGNNDGCDRNDRPTGVREVQGWRGQAEHQERRQSKMARPAKDQDRDRKCYDYAKIGTEVPRTIDGRDGAANVTVGYPLMPEIPPRQAVDDPERSDDDAAPEK